MNGKGYVAHARLIRRHADRGTPPPPDGKPVAPLAHAHRSRLGILAKHGDGATRELAGLDLGGVGRDANAPMTLAYPECP